MPRVMQLLKAMPTRNQLAASDMGEGRKTSYPDRGKMLALK